MISSMSPASRIPLCPGLPRELIDHIITDLIHLYDDQPTYQWIRLRYITRYHKDYMESYFLRFWIPKLTFTVSEDWRSIRYTARRIKDRPMSDIIRLKPRDGWENISQSLMDWEDIIMQTTYPVGDERMRQKRLIIRLGQGYLHKGYTEGGLFSDIVVPELNIDPSGSGDILFSWKLLFTALFREEMLMEKFRAKKLSGFLPTLRVTKPEKRHSAIHKFLQEHCQSQQRQLLTYFRDHIASPDHGPFSLSPYLNLSDTDPDFSSLRTYRGVLSIVYHEESMIFHVPDWETWDVREIARLRVDEEEKRENLFPCEEGIVPSVAYLSIPERWEFMLGNKTIGEDTLRDYLTKGVWVDI
ncbi:hypothetical protein IQ07DRAFT_405573 [Pyrenochaeta sp. DS3sAY3a]|nr:hypothetical protein IQ07DRAFT_405573 [Pyrenochaeta sp. DS3sAY3a]